MSEMKSGQGINRIEKLRVSKIKGMAGFHGIRGWKDSDIIVEKGLVNVGVTLRRRKTDSVGASGNLRHCQTTPEQWDKLKA